MFLKSLAGAGLALSLAAGLWTIAASAQEKPGLGGTGTISGTITFTDGKPAVNRPVEWRPMGDPNGGSTVQTDSSGLYVIQGLKDGQYFVGYFHPSRLPVDKNPNVEVAPDSASTELTAIGRPLVQRVTITQGQSVKGIDFVITNIGDEQVEGPESGDPNAVPPGLPDTGTQPAVAPSAGSGRNWVPWTLSAAVVMGLFGIAALLAPGLARRRNG